jgi:hypothetical protein
MQHDVNEVNEWRLGWGWGLCLAFGAWGSLGMVWALFTADAPAINDTVQRVWRLVGFLIRVAVLYGLSAS